MSMGIDQSRHHDAPVQVKNGGVARADRDVRDFADAIALDEDVTPLARLVAPGVDDRCVAQKDEVGHANSP